MSHTNFTICPFTIFTPANPEEPYYYIVDVNAFNYPYPLPTGCYPLLSHPRVIRQLSFTNEITRKPSPLLAELNKNISRIISQIKFSCFPCDGWPIGYSKLNDPRPSHWPLNGLPAQRNNKRNIDSNECDLPSCKRNKSTGSL